MRHGVVARATTTIVRHLLVKPAPARAQKRPINRDRVAVVFPARRTGFRRE
jgi:hypothetical protein